MTNYTEMILQGHPGVTWSAAALQFQAEHATHPAEKKQ
jgi:hypothetical protein